MKTIAVFTATRAEYGLLYWTLRGLEEAQDINLQIYVGGTHLSYDYGYTIQDIQNDGFQIDEKMEFLMASDSAVGVTKSMGLAMISAAEVLERRNPDLVLLLGDRYETLAFAQASVLAGIPIAHVHGGEKTSGAIDDSFRHAITKLSHLHFTATERYRQRVIQLGESPSTVWNVGAPGLSNIANLQFLTREELSEQLSFSLDTKYFVVTYHPVTAEGNAGLDGLKALIDALHSFSSYSVIITYPNADTCSRQCIEAIQAFADEHANRVLLVKSLGTLRYMSLVKYCSAVIGNSSSGIIEAPSLNVPTVNIGNRQQGRECGTSVIHCDATLKDIVFAIEKAVKADFQQHCQNVENPYFQEHTSAQIVELLRDVRLTDMFKKCFFDVLLPKNIN